MMDHAWKPLWVRVPMIAALVLLSSSQASGQTGPPPLRVIVKLEVDANPERMLSKPAMRAQRRRIARQRVRLEDRLRGSGARVLRRYQSLPFVALEVPHEALATLATSDTVALIEGDRLFEASLAQSTAQVQAGDVHELGFDGAGWHIAILDTGIETTHPALVGRTDEEACFSAQGDCPGGSTQAFGSGAAAPCGVSGCYHGTHVAGIALGDDPVYRGVAPGAHLIAVQIFSEFSGSNCSSGGECAMAYTSDIMRGLEYVYGLRDSYSIAAVNLSLGGGYYASQFECDQANGFLLRLVDDLRGAGIATIIASGNDGYIDALAAPGCLSSAVSVGSVTKQSQVSSFSNSADFLDLLAPGSLIVSAVPVQSFATLSGTSMATPHVAGAWALCLQNRGQATVGEVLLALRAGGTPIFDPGNELVHPLIQLGSIIVPEPAASAALLAALLGLASLRRVG